ncbi:dTMP kinase [Methylonatrum kenyense]|uniref:dTMP kinase n=1 Tax=Methylonatrum kenyense TaxID=455253 RepID=UPI0020C148ED|nr:dTMP kinase [Methylonatrum kenyense]MCK8516500.1 dTMP kinase [Methylonatrum kenyense]
MPGRGRFITLEGIEGAGKSTAMGVIQACLEQAGHTVVKTREPGGTALGESVRHLLLQPSEQAMSPKTEALLMFAARAEHLDKVIEPALQRGDWVLCDRFTDASYAYQGAGRQLGSEAISILEHWVQGSMRPDLTVLLDLPPDTGLDRAAGRGQPADRFESENAVFFQRIRQAYLDRVQAEPTRYRCIDAAQPLEEVRHALQETMQQWIGQQAKSRQ